MFTVAGWNKNDKLVVIEELAGNDLEDLVDEYAYLLEDLIKEYGKETVSVVNVYEDGKFIGYIQEKSYGSYEFVRED